MSFTTLLEVGTFENQPQEPATTCHDGQPATGWTWTGRNWEPACDTHISRVSGNRILNTEFLEDW